MSFFVRAGKRRFLCGECGEIVTARGRDHHIASEGHAQAVTTEAYRHRDDSAHAIWGPVGCYVCAELRRIEREAERFDSPVVAALRKRIRGEPTTEAEDALLNMPLTDAQRARIAGPNIPHAEVMAELEARRKTEAPG